MSRGIALALCALLAALWMPRAEAATLHDTCLASNDAPQTTLTCADALAVTTGDLVFCGTKWEGAITTRTVDTGASTPAFTSANDPLHESGGSDDLNGATSYWIATSTGTVTPRVVLGAARPFRKIKCYSFTPAGGTTLELDAVAAQTQVAVTSVSTGAASATAAGVAVGFFHLYSTDTLTPGTGWSEAAEFNISDAQVTEYQLHTGAGSLTADGELGSGAHSVSQLAIFREVATGGGGSAVPVILQQQAANDDEYERPLVANSR